VRSAKTSTELDKALRKVWLRITPIVFLFYVIAFLHRVNISFAISSMESQLGLTAAVLGLASGIFFIGCFIFQVPGTYYVEKIGAKKIITVFLIGWGIFAALTGASSSAPELYFFRFMEGAFFPGIIYYISLWFPARRRATAMALFLTAIPVSEIIGAPRVVSDNNGELPRLEIPVLHRRGSRNSSGDACAGHHNEPASERQMAYP
jgi:ACS family tartrate transporter-like MFS transporter